MLEEPVLLILSTPIGNALVNLTRAITKPAMAFCFLFGTVIFLISVARKVLKKEQTPSPFTYVGLEIVSIGLIALGSFVATSETRWIASIPGKIILAIFWGGGLAGFIYCSKKLEQNNKEEDT